MIRVLSVLVTICVATFSAPALADDWANKVKGKNCYEHTANKGDACKDDACMGSAAAQGKEG